jgi:glyoxylase-like metal-dependent hydrolase (beta-lactamase superfamily II)
MSHELTLSDDDVIPLDIIAERVIGLQILFVNLFAISAKDGSWVLVDTGLRHAGDRIRRWVLEKFPANPAPLAIILTHGHFDHVGTVRELAEEWDVPVYAHQRELPYLTGDKSYPDPDPSVGGGAMARLSFLYPQEPIDLGGRVRALPEDGSVPGLTGWLAIPTPGHTEGHIVLFREQDGLLIGGDAFCTTKNESLVSVMTQKPELSGPPKYFTPDWKGAKESMERMARLEPAILAPSHGLPMRGKDAIVAFQELTERFDELAKPEQGKYV